MKKLIPNVEKDKTEDEAGKVIPSLLDTHTNISSKQNTATTMLTDKIG